MLGAGHQVTLLTNSDANSGNLSGNFSVSTLPFSESRSKKIALLISRPIVERKVKRLSLSHDIAYVPGKLLFLAPALKKANPSLRIITHLHDYQLVCPHASLYNFLDCKRCSYVRSKRICMRCTYTYESVEKGGLHIPFFGALETYVWMHLMTISHIQDILDSTASFVTVSSVQAKLIADVLGQYSKDFAKKNTTIYNPMDAGVEYVPPSLGGDVCLGFFGGDRYLKGFDDILGLVRHLGDNSFNLLATRISTPLKTDRLELLGVLDQEKMVEVFKRISLVLFMSRWDEPLPYALVEGQLRGRPVLTTPVGGVAEAIAKPGFTGEVVEGGYEAFETHINTYSSKLVERREYSREISSVARRFFEARSNESYEKFLELVG